MPDHTTDTQRIAELEAEIGDLKQWVDALMNFSFAMASAPFVLSNSKDALVEQIAKIGPTDRDGAFNPRYPDVVDAFREHLARKASEMPNT